MSKQRSLSVEARRQLVLKEVLAGNGHVRALSSRLGVSAATVRRDLQYLTETGATARTYGGAIAGPRPLELSLREKDVRNRPEKGAIASLAASLVDDGDSIILDAGTTAGRLAGELRNRRDLTVVTNGITAITELAEADEIDLLVIGGQLRHISQALIGPLAELLLRHTTVDKAFLGAEGFTENGICCPSPAHSSLKSLMASRATELFILIDHSKLGRRPHHYWAPCHSTFTVITDEKARDEDLAMVEAAGGRVLVAKIRSDEDVTTTGGTDLSTSRRTG